MYLLVLRLPVPGRGFGQAPFGFLMQPLPHPSERKPAAAPRSTVAARHVDALFPGDLAAAVITAASGHPVPVDSIAHKTIGLYFSAAWCGPCKAFTPILAKVYAERRAAGLDDFEVVFVSHDHSADRAREYAAHMPWLMLQYDAVETFYSTACKQPSSLPTLLLVHPTDPRKLQPQGRELLLQLATRGDSTAPLWP